MIIKIQMQLEQADYQPATKETRASAPGMLGQYDRMLYRLLIESAAQLNWRLIGNLVRLVKATPWGGYVPKSMEAVDIAELLRAGAESPTNRNYDMQLSAQERLNVQKMVAWATRKVRLAYEPLFDQATGADRAKVHYPDSHTTSYLEARADELQLVLLYLDDLSWVLHDAHLGPGFEFTDYEDCRSADDTFLREHINNALKQIGKEVES